MGKGAFVRGRITEAILRDDSTRPLFHVIKNGFVPPPCRPIFPGVARFFATPSNCQHEPPAVSDRLPASPCDVAGYSQVGIQLVIKCSVFRAHQDVPSTPWQYCADKIWRKEEGDYFAVGRLKDTLQEVYNRLYQAYGPQNWWPAEDSFEVLVGAVLVQNTNWKNVEKAIRKLKTAGYLDPDRLYRLPEEELAELIRPAGYFRVKAKRLKNLIKLIVERYGGSLARMFRQSMEKLRQELLGVHGIGRETADSILLYAGHFPTFVVDTYTYRVMTRHGWAPFEADYDSLKELFEENLPSDPKLFNEFHALFVQVGKKHCRTLPRCEGCPLAPMLPPSGPLTPEW